MTLRLKRTELGYTVRAGGEVWYVRNAGEFNRVYRGTSSHWVAEGAGRELTARTLGQLKQRLEELS